MKTKQIINLFFIILFANYSLAQSFGEHHTVTGGRISSPQIHSCDIDNDGDIDILSVSTSDLSLLENLGNGEYAYQKTIVEDEYEPTNISSLDVDNDGLLDIVYSYYSKTRRLAWRKNMGNNEFGESIIIHDRLYYLGKFEICDLNNDGYDDMVLKSGQEGLRLTTIKNLGNGHFAPPDTLLAEDYSVYFQVIDFNHDSFLDIVYYQRGNGKIAWLENDGDGNFIEENIIFTGTIESFYYSFHSFDYDNDGDYDIIVGGETDSIRLLINNGQYEFNEVFKLPGDSDFRLIKSFDFDYDGDLDIIFTRGGSFSNSLKIFINQGENTFSTSIIENELLEVNSFEIYDIDKNGFDDIIAANDWGGLIVWLENSENSHFVNMHSLTSHLFSAYSVDAKDVDGDGVNDICVKDSRHKTTFFINDGKGNFTDSITTGNLHRYSHGLLFDDINNDGYCDILSYSDYSGEYYDDSSHFFFARNNGDRTFAKIGENHFNHLKNQMSLFFDYNLDGKSEIILFDSDAIDTIYFFGINEDFSVSLLDTFTTINPIEIEKLLLGDIDSNGETDLIFQTNRTILVSYSVDGVFNSNYDTIYSSLSQFYGIVAIANINNDPYLDFALSFKNKIKILENSGDQEILEYDLFLLQKDIFNLISYNIDKDGPDEILLTTKNDELVLIKNINESNFEIETYSYINYRGFDYYKSHTFRDLDNDGDLDFLTCDYYQSNISWLENNFIHASIKENTTVQAFNIYPNPARETINIDFTERITSSATVVLFDNLGKEISQYNVKAGQPKLSIGTENLKSGIYFLVLKTEQRINSSKVLIVK